MHEIAHADCFRAWMYAIVVYYRACERGNRIRAVVGCGIDLRRRRNAPSQSASTHRDSERLRWKGGFSPLLFQFLLLLFIQPLTLMNPVIVWREPGAVERQTDRWRYGGGCRPRQQRRARSYAELVRNWRSVTALVGAPRRRSYLFGFEDWRTRF